MNQEPRKLTAAQEQALLRQLAAMPNSLSGPHMTDEEFAAYAAEFLEPEAAAHVERHLESCEVCLEQMEKMLVVSQRWDAHTERLTLLEDLTQAQAALTLGDHPSIASRQTLPPLAGRAKKENEQATVQEALQPVPGRFRERPRNWRQRPAWSVGAWVAAGVFGILTAFWIGVQPILRQKDSAEQQARTAQALASQVQSQARSQIRQAQLRETATQDELTQARRQRAASPAALAAVQRRFQQQEARQTAQLQALREKLRHATPAASSASPSGLMARGTSDVTIPNVTIPTQELHILTNQGVLMGGGATGALAVRFPVGEFVLSDRPAFRWTQARDESGKAATYYIVKVWDARRGPDLPLQTSPHVAGTSWTPSTPLPRDQVLQWQVQAYQGNDLIDAAPKLNATVKFRIVGRNRARALSRMQTALARDYAGNGLLAEAQEELDAALQADPHNSAAQRLLGRVQNARPRTPSR